MSISLEALNAYSIAILSGAQYSNYLSQSLLIWPIITLLFVIPSINLCINLGYISANGPVLTYQRIAPITAGVGCALAWLAGERLYLQSLTAAQYFLYIIYSIRRRLDWALDCDHGFNNDLCVDFIKENISHGEFQHQPSNNWPAQQFNRHAIRGVELIINVTEWVPNAWYFGDMNTVQQFNIEMPSLLLTLSHIFVWILLFSVVHRYGFNPGWFLARFCILLPIVLLTLIVFVLTIFDFSFSQNNESELIQQNVEKYPYVYFSELHGYFRTTMMIMDYSSAFTGIILFASSKIKSNSLPINPFILTFIQMIFPILMIIFRRGCNGHLSKIQPAYDSFIATDETFSFDTAAVCLATSTAGPFMAFLYYLANFLHTCIGPMAVFLLFIENALSEQFGLNESYSGCIFGLLSTFYAISGLILNMPFGTALVTFMDFISQSTITHIFLFVVVIFIYGWNNLDEDIRMIYGMPNFSSLFTYLTGPLSPTYIILLFTTVPALLAAKFTSVYDLLMTGGDVSKHINYGFNFFSAELFNHFIGGILILMPTTFIITFALFNLWRNVFVYKLSIGSLLDATSEWKSHISVRQINMNRMEPLSHRLYISLTHLPYKTSLFAIFITEIVIFFLLGILFVSNLLYSRSYTTSEAGSVNNFRTVLLLIFIVFHIFSLFEIRWTLQSWDDSARLNVYIGVAVMETAFLNGYMWLFAVNHSWGLLIAPILVIVMNTLSRGIMIGTAIAIRWNIYNLIQNINELYDRNIDFDNEMDNIDIDGSVMTQIRRDIM